jgi:polyisoprenoid-binding protein YceI
MKRSILALVFASLVLGPLTSAEAAVETYDNDLVQTWVGFTISHVFTKVPGYFGKLKGTIAVDRGMIGNSVDVVIHVEADQRKPEPATR